MLLWILPVLFKFSLFRTCKIGAEKCQQWLFDPLRDPWGPQGGAGTAIAPVPLHGEVPGICSPWKNSWQQVGKSRAVFTESLYSVRQIPGKSAKVLMCPLRMLFYLFAVHSNRTDFTWNSVSFSIKVCSDKSRVLTLAALGQVLLWILGHQ